MSLLAGYFLPAMLVSSAALVALRVAASAPSRIKFGLASIGLVAWFVPWPTLHLTGLASPGLPFGSWVSGGTAALLAFAQDIEPAVVAASPIAKLPIAWWIFLSAPGLVWFVAEFLSYRATVNCWRRSSRSAAQLARHMPAGIRTHAPKIRLVAQSSIAVATGWRKATIWIGDRVVDHDELTIALTHEASHIRRGDPLWLMAIGLIARLTWFNPFARALRQHAILAIEAGCDQECARLLGRKRYQNTLAQLVLQSQTHRSLALVPMLHSTKVDLARIALLDGRPRMGAAAWAAVVLMILAGAGGASLAAPATPATSPANNTAITAASRYGYDEAPTWQLQPGAIR
jgi:beta-lactamase regulating signal transducer with metallopeptidase domain